MVAPKAQAPYPDAEFDFLAVLRFHAMDTEIYTDSAPRMPLGQSSLSLSKVQSGGMSETTRILRCTAFILRQPCFIRETKQ
jgi:hypothetical protein